MKRRSSSAVASPERAVIRRATALGGVDILAAQYIEHRFHRHVHDEAVIAVYLAGVEGFVCGAQRGVVGPGQILVIGPQTAHEGWSADEGGWTYLAAYPRVAALAEATGMTAAAVEAALGSYRLLERPKHFDLLRCALSAVHLEPQRLGAHEQLIEALGRFVRELSDKLPAPFPETNQPALRRVRELIGDCFRQSLPLQDLARVAGVTSEHLVRTFKRQYGISPHALISTLRTAAARDLIRQGVALSEVAATAGFADQSHMTRWMKRIYGVTPGAFAGIKNVQDFQRLRSPQLAQ